RGDDLVRTLLGRDELVVVLVGEEAAPGVSTCRALGAYVLVGSQYERVWAEQGGNRRPAFRPWEEIDEDFRDQNRDQARWYPRFLSEEGYELRRVTDAPIRPVRLDVGVVKRLARREHARWMRLKLAQGWRYGPVDDPENRLNPRL